MNFWIFALLLSNFFAVYYVATQECFIGEFIVKQGVNVNIRPEEVIKCPEGGECFQTLCALSIDPTVVRIRYGCNISGWVADDNNPQEQCKATASGATPCKPQPNAEPCTAEYYWGDGFCYDGEGRSNDDLQSWSCPYLDDYCATTLCRKKDGIDYLSKGCSSGQFQLDDTIRSDRKRMIKCVESAKQCRESGGTPGPCELCVGHKCNDRELVETTTTENTTTEEATTQKTGPTMSPGSGTSSTIFISCKIGLLLVVLTKLAIQLFYI